MAMDCLAIAMVNTLPKHNDFILASLDVSNSVSLALSGWYRFQKKAAVQPLHRRIVPPLSNSICLPS
jgi:hypothetical protein